MMMMMMMTYRLATVHNVTDRRQTDGRHIVSCARPLPTGQKICFVVSN